MPPPPSSPGEGARPFSYRFLHRIVPSELEPFLAVEQRLRQAAGTCPGFVAESGPRPLGWGESGGEVLYESVLSFATLRDFMRWMDSPERRAILRTAEQNGYRYEGHTDWEGYARWLGETVRSEVPTWKVNLLVLLVLYPSVMVLGVVLRPLPVDAPTGLLLGNVCSVALTGWWLVPWVSRLFRPWLEGSGSRRGRSLALAAILVALVLMLQLFRALPATRGA